MALLKGALRRKALGERLVFLPMLAAAQRNSGANGGRSASGSRLAKLALPWRILERRWPALRVRRVRALRSLALLLLCRGIRTLSSLSSLNSSPCPKKRTSPN